MAGSTEKEAQTKKQHTVAVVSAAVDVLGGVSTADAGPRPP